MTVDDTQAEQLASKASVAAHLTSSSNTDIQSLYTTALEQRTRLEQHHDDQYLSLAPTFLSLHQQASSSKQLLSSLESFLSTFQSDLSTLSTHISALQNTSHQIDSRLDATRDVEIQLASFLSDIALSPRIVDLFFETEPESRPELWQKAVKQLERVLEATSPSATLQLPPASGDAKESVTVGDVQAVKEVRAVAEACRNVVAGKLRSYLIAPHASIKASVTTNLQVLQTSILLRHHRPLYAFLARQMPRVAIDVQRSYVAAARLYFETAFRRYARSLGVIRKRWVEPSTSSLITDPLPSSSSSSGGYAATAMSTLQNSMAALSKTAAGAGSSASFLPPTARQAGGSNTPAKDASNTSDADATSGTTDPWLFSAPRLQYARLESNAATVLGYLADDASFKACPENLFRSLSLVLLDNACSEYTFLVRFFEGIGSEDDVAQAERAGGGSKGSAASTPGAGAAVGPDESASVTGADDTVGGADDDAAGPEPTVVQLSAAEQRRLKGRGASDEIFKQIMEPSVSTWVSFTKTLLTPATSVVSSTVTGSSTAGGAGSSVASTPAGYFALLSMIQLNDALLDMLRARGCSNALVETALMGFKIQAYPLVKRFLDDQIAALAALTSSPSASSTSASGMWGMLSTLTTSSLTSHLSLTSSLAEALVLRYASLFTKTLWILQDTLDQGILSALTRLRAELAKAIVSSKETEKWARRDKAAAVRLVMEASEAVLSVTALASHPKVQNEFSFWNETLKSIPA
ncbi:related to VPS52-component of the Golgi-associated retrograde protein complex [Sporisorium reilianum f. sp. reilianum]|uniref:Related to VPS52-component of the Golgi-associated retrograde protein complex n=1 Tax=Sporisorium reilianum f. sp. reilianum TaxID=72559 RepID=A0A2N8UA83_9BASI|nr:related to VPS52-component of the Golgi-associated retrograde protein complex [Sporisorium reilianum f. sp. reilianum]